MTGVQHTGGVSDSKDIVRGSVALEFPDLTAKISVLTLCQYWF